MPECNVNGCEDSAVAKLVGHDGYQKAYRCRECLLFDLDLNGGDDGDVATADD